VRISEEGLALIRDYEGLALTAYLCPAGVWTIGFGHTKGVKKGDTCTKEQAELWLREDVRDAEAIVDASVDVPLTQGQYDALVSWVFNLGGVRLGASTLLRMLNQGDYKGAAAQFDRWVYAGKERLPGLIKRRAAERALFERPGG
jgi:lysozyme